MIRPMPGPNRPLSQQRQCDKRVSACVVDACAEEVEEGGVMRETHEFSVPVDGSAPEGEGHTLVL
jgi:hypothetical protein